MSKQIICVCCKILVRSDNMARHRGTKTHLLYEQGKEKYTLCKICGKEILSRNWEAHLTGDRRRKQSVALRRCEEQKKKLGGTQ